MGLFQMESVVLAEVRQTFDFLSRSASLIKIAPDNAQLTLIDGPDDFRQGDQLEWRIKRWGLSQQITVRVVDWIENQSIVMEQTKGPLKRWRHTQVFAAGDACTELCDMVEYEPPGGILGLTVTATWIEKDLKETFAHRNRRLIELFPHRESDKNE